MTNLEIYNVKYYGAKGDGLTDDTAAFKSALAACKTVFVPEGAFVISDTLSLGTNQHLVGAGPESTFIWANHNKDIIQMHNGVCGSIKDLSIWTKVSRSTSVYAISISDFAETTLSNLFLFDNNTHTLSTGGGICYGTNSSIGFIDNISIEIRGNGTGIYIEDGNDRFFNNIWMRGSAREANDYHSAHGTGIFINTSGGDFFTNIDVVQFDNDLFIVKEVITLKFANCLFDSTVKRGVHIVGQTAVKRVTFTNCWFGSCGMFASDYNTASAVLLEGICQNISFIGCSFASNRAQSILCNSSSLNGLIVSGCTFTDNSLSAANGYDELHLLGSNVIITDNIFNNSSNNYSRYAIFLNTGANYIVKNNIGRGATGFMFDGAVTGLVKSDNIVIA